MALTKAHYRMIDGPIGNVKDFGAVGDDVTDDAVAIQAAVTAICGANGTLIFPPGNYRLGATITFPNTSFVLEGAGPTGTSVAALPSVPSTTLFDFTGCNGPAKHIKNLSFKGPVTGSYGGTAVKAYGNGFLFDNCWFRGIGVGIDAQGSFINTDNCVAEFCFEAIKCASALDETIWASWTMYKNETDFILNGDNKTFTIRDTNCIGTKTKVFNLSCNGVLIDGVTVQDDGTGYTPDIFEINGSQNIINNVNIHSFGNRGFFFQGVGVIRNRVSNVMIYNIANGVLFSQASRNVMSNITIRDCQSGYGVFFDSCNENIIENFLFQGNDYNVRISAASENSLHNGIMSNAQTADFYFPVVNADKIYTSNVAADFSGIASLPYKISILAGGQKQVIAPAAPTTETWAVGDVCINSAPVVGSPKGWRCTVGGTPGTWVSEGNL